MFSESMFRWLWKQYDLQSKKFRNVVWVNGYLKKKTFKEIMLPVIRLYNMLDKWGIDSTYVKNGLKISSIYHTLK